MGVDIRAMDDDAIQRWLDRAHAAYVADLISSGAGKGAAERTASEQEAAAFPDGQPASGHAVFDVAVDGEVVGHLWIGPRDPEDEDHWWVWDVEIDEAWRDRGIGSAAMQFAEQHARDRGCVDIGLNVMADNRARRLYESLGYEEASVRMRKPLRS
jgi:ribosomal protein S18 acetylase RimI-like enzyme